MVDCQEWIVLFQSLLDIIQEETKLINQVEIKT